MFCRFCGNTLKDQSRFCNQCGKTTDSRETPVRQDKPYTVLYILGALLILAGILPYLVRGSAEAYNTYIANVVYRQGPRMTSAFSLLRAAIGQYANVLDFLSSMLAVLLGCLILKKASKLTFPLIACLVAYGAAMIFDLIVCCCPSVFLSDDRGIELMEAGKELLASNPNLLYWHQDNALCRLVVSFGVIGLAIAAVCVHKGYQTNERQKWVKIPSVGSVLMILCAAGLSVVENLRTEALIDSYTFVGYIAAGSAFNKVCPTLLLVVVFAAILGITTIRFRKNRWVSPVAIGGMFSLLFLFVLVFGRQILMGMFVDADWLSIAVSALPGKALNCSLIFIAMFFWFDAVSRNYIPMWLQILWPLLLPVVYLLMDVIVQFGIFHMHDLVSFGAVTVSLITILLSKLPYAQKKRAEEAVMYQL